MTFLLILCCVELCLIGSRDREFHFGESDILKPTYVPELIPMRPRRVALKSGIVKLLHTEATKTMPRMMVHAIIWKRWKLIPVSSRRMSGKKPSDLATGDGSAARLLVTSIR